MRETQGQVFLFTVNSSGIDVTMARPVKSFAIQCRDFVDMQFKTPIDSDYWTIRAGSVYSDKVEAAKFAGQSNTIGNLKTNGPTVTAEVKVYW